MTDEQIKEASREFAHFRKDFDDILTKLKAE